MYFEAVGTHLVCCEHEQGAQEFAAIRPTGRARVLRNIEGKVVGTSTKPPAALVGEAAGRAVWGLGSYKAEPDLSRDVCTTCSPPKSW